MEIIIVTGMSGAGKSAAIDCFEEMGYYCTDNMPPSLIKNFIDLMNNGKTNVKKAVFVVDIRGGEFFDDLNNALADLKEKKVPWDILFLDATDDTLIRRFSETRRTHPLASNGSNLDGIKEERNRLEPLKKRADYVIDTTNLKTMELSEKIREIFLDSEEGRGFSISIMSFGYKYGIPSEADMIFDMRFIPNPFYVEGLKELTGLTKEVQDYVMKAPESSFFKEEIIELIETLKPSYIRQGKYSLKISFGCTGGQHRSVTMAEQVAKEFIRRDENVSVKHREL